MKPEDIDIDWIYLIERIESLIDLGEELLGRRLAVAEIDPQTLAQSLAFLWIRDGAGGHLREVTDPDIPSLRDLVGIEKTIEILRRNTMQFVLGYPANDALLWGTAGSGKSSCIKGLLNEFAALGLRLLEVRKEDFEQLPVITKPLQSLPYHFVLYCKDLSFREEDSSYQEFKRFLDGGIDGRPKNLIAYATSSNRNLLPERMTEGYIPSETAQTTKDPLADRFGLQLPFFAMDEERFLKIIHQMLKRFGIRTRRTTVEKEARQWAMAHGGQSGRIAAQYARDLAGRHYLAKNVKNFGRAKKF